jgi:hypothetical protein
MRCLCRGIAALTNMPRVLLHLLLVLLLLLLLQDDDDSDDDDDVDDDEALEEALLQGGKMAQREQLFNSAKFAQTAPLLCCLCFAAGMHSGILQLSFLQWVCPVCKQERVAGLASLSSTASMDK